MSVVAFKQVDVLLHKHLKVILLQSLWTPVP